jgi:hypothetical protein
MVGKIKEYLPEKEFIKVYIVIWSAKTGTILKK